MARKLRQATLVDVDNIDYALTLLARARKAARCAGVSVRTLRGRRLLCLTTAMER